jgi:UDP-glucose:(heptosyl)LPS alpha-1,3-glucosyltransferase
MKIAVIRKKYTYHGGAEGFSHELMNRLSAEGHEVHVYAIQWENTHDQKNIFFHRVPALTFNSALRDLSFALSACRLLQKEHYDIVQSHDKTLCQDIYRAGDGCHQEWLRQRWKRTGIPGKLSMLLNPYHWLILLLERKILKGHCFRKVLAISEMVKRNLIEHYHVDEHAIEVIYNGVDLERFHPAHRGRYRKEIRERHSIPDDAFVVLFVGSGFERKGLAFLLKAAESVPHPVTVLIVGKGPAGKYARFIKNQKVVFCGPQKEVHKYYAASDIFVFPTLYEPFGNVHLEALASGLPVITTYLSGAAEIIRDGIHGFVVPLPEDYPAIGEKIRLLLENPQERERISANARMLAEEFSFKRHSERLLKLYQSLTSPLRTYR